MAGNLHNDEAQSRSRLVTTHGYDIHLDLTHGPERFLVDAQLRFSANRNEETTFVDFAAGEAEELKVILNGVPLEPDRCIDYDKERIYLVPVRGANHLRIEARMPYSRSGRGLHYATDSQDGSSYVWSVFQPADASRVFPCFDQPDLKAEFAIEIDTPPDWMSMSNQPLLEQHAAPRGIRSRFATSPPLPTYLVAFGAGHYQSVESAWRGIPLRLLCRRSIFDHLDAQEIMEVTKSGLSYFTEFFQTPFPFQKYDQIFAPELGHGGMENAACVVMNEDYIFRSRPLCTDRERRASTILHELAHMWFGDYVTMRWWDDLWLNEAFATWAATDALTQATQFTDAWTSFSLHCKQAAICQEGRPSAHPIVNQIPDVATSEISFDPITYGKGGAALKQLVYRIGRRSFSSAIAAYFANHCWSNADLSDFLRALGPHVDLDLGAWADRWLRTSGVGRVASELMPAQDPGHSDPTVQLRATGWSGGILPQAFEVVQLQHGPNSWIRREHSVTLDEGTQVARVGQHLAGAVVVPDVTDCGYAIIEMDPMSERQFRRLKGALGTNLGSAVAWTSMWNRCRAGLHPASQFVVDVAQAVSVEMPLVLAESLSKWARYAINHYCAGQRRTQARLVFGKALVRRLRSAPSGSETQLGSITALAGVAAGEELELLWDLYTRKWVPDGVVMTRPLEWALLRACVRGGVAGADDIDALSQRDPTSNGRLEAICSRAALPTPNAKAAAWEAIGSSDGGAGAEMTARLEGFVDPDHDGLLQPYALAYFDLLPTVYRSWPTTSARRFIAQAFPQVINDEVVARSRAFTHSGGHPAWVMQLVCDHVADQERNINARNADLAGEPVGV